jgi:hypothetical protein
MVDPYPGFWRRSIETCMSPCPTIQSQNLPQQDANSAVVFAQDKRANGNSFRVSEARVEPHCARGHRVRRQSAFVTLLPSLEPRSIASIQHNTVLWQVAWYHPVLLCMYCMSGHPPSSPRMTAAISWTPAPCHRGQVMERPHRLAFSFRGSANPLSRASKKTQDSRLSVSLSESCLEFPVEAYRATETARRFHFTT